MDLFGRKKKKEEELAAEEAAQKEEEQKKLDLENKKLKRKLKDLSPENKKARKEPVKPWGKKERILVGAFFIFTTLVTTILFLMSHDYKLPGLPRIGFRHLNFENPFGEQIIELGQKKSNGTADQRADLAINFFEEQTKPLSGYYGFYVYRLTDGTSYGISTRGSFQGASLLKLPLMVLMFKMAEQGSLDLNTKYVLKESDKVKGSGVLYVAKPGSVYTYRDLAMYMGRDSDRTAYNIMKRVIGDEKLKEFVSSVGMLRTNVETGYTTPSDIGILLKVIWNGEVINDSDKKEILGFLTNTAYEKWISAGVPKGVTVAHKFGQDSAVMADGGIIEANDPYIFVIMGNGITQHDADLLFPTISSKIYNIESGVQ